MNSLTKNLLNLVIILLAAAIIGGVAYWYWWGQTKLPVLDRAADFTMTNVKTGQPESFHETAGARVKLVEFIYMNCPDICPATTLNMAKIQNELKTKKLFGKDVEFAAITFDPARDTPDVIKKYADGMKLDWNGWAFYRGTEDQTKEVLKSYKLIAEKQDDGTYMHQIRSLYLIDRHNNIRKIYRMGQDMNDQEILQDIVRLTKEK